MVERNLQNLQPGDISAVPPSTPLLSAEPDSSKQPDSLEKSTRDEPDTPNIGFFRRMLWNLHKGFFSHYIPDNLYTIDFKLLFIFDCHIHFTDISIQADW